jgi:hypothetical protein
VSPAVGAPHRDHVYVVHQVISMMLWCRSGEIRDFWASLSLESGVSTR